MKERLLFALFCIQHRRSLSAQIRWQERHLRRIVTHANKNVPLWRKMFADNHIDPAGIRRVSDLEKLPIASKQTFFGRMADEYTDSSRPAHSYWYVTSGTSGTPFTFMMSDHARQIKYVDFNSFRFLWWRGEPLHSIFTLKFARIRIRARTTPRRLFVPVPEYLKDPKTALKKIADFGPYLLSTYPSILIDIARTVKEDPSLKIPGLRYAMSFGENLTSAVREATEEALGCEVYDRYGLEEIGAVGVDCHMHDGFHINTESVLIEIVDEDGMQLPPGETGRVLATDLFNYSMPFIRYDTGDRGKISVEKCACGLRSPRLWVKGRYSAYLNFPGRRIHHLEFDAAMDGFMNYIFQYQIVKLSDSKISARIVAGPAYHSGVPEMITGSLRELMGQGVEILVEQVKDIAISDSGKSRIVSDESNDAHPGTAQTI